MDHEGTKAQRESIPDEVENDVPKRIVSLGSYRLQVFRPLIS